MAHYIRMNNMFHGLTTYRGQGNRSIVGRLRAVPFLEDWRNVCAEIETYLHLFKGGYDYSYKKTSKKVVLFQESMYMCTLKRVSKTAKFGKKGMFFKLEIVVRV